jgi:hypothetical protein
MQYKLAIEIFQMGPGRLAVEDVILFFPMPYSPSFIDLLSGGIATMVTRWIG